MITEQQLQDLNRRTQKLIFRLAIEGTLVAKHVCARDRAIRKVLSMTGKILICGEAWGAEEEREGRPFVGATGRLLKGCLSQVGISFIECFVTNVLNFRPKPNNDIRNVCGPKSEGIPGRPAVVPGKYMRAKYAGEIERLLNEVCNFNPTLILALGGTAAWALLRTSGIKFIRGAPIAAQIQDKTFKVLPTYHPAAILREWKNRPIFLSDLYKARAESEFPEIRRPRREIWVAPDLTDLYKFEKLHILPSPDLSIDIETAGNQITCIGFAPTINISLVVPFFDHTKPGNNYWTNEVDEERAWEWVKHICSLPKCIVGQNGLYDIHFLWRSYGITVPYYSEDCMLLHHALQPEMEKGLGFLGSIYTNEVTWKFMRKSRTIKRED